MEDNAYYPYGLTMAGISDKAVKTNYAENKFRYNGGNELQNKEFSDGSGLEMYDANFRGYDPQLGRFWQIDPLADAEPDWSSYSFANDNPVVLNDPLGLSADTSVLPTATVTHAPPPRRSSITVGLADTKGGTPNVTAGPAPSSVSAPIKAQNNDYTQGNTIDINSINSNAGDITITQFRSGSQNGFSGVEINLLYKDNNSGLSHFNWIQTIRTNVPRTSVQSPYNDPQPPDDNLPFYWTNKELPIYNVSSGYNARFYDYPKRAAQKTLVKWQAELSLVGKNTNGQYVNIITLRYGFNVSPNGNTTIQHLIISQPSSFQLGSIKTAR